MRFEKLDFPEQIKFLKRLHKRINKRLFNGELGKVFIDIENINKYYEDGYEAAACFRKTSDKYPELFPKAILISHEYERDIESLPTQKEQILQLFGLLLHEMIHQYCYENGIDDGNHNEAWQKAAEEHGLISKYEDGKPSETIETLTSKGELVLAITLENMRIN